jgi:hypothetical protein
MAANTPKAPRPAHVPGLSMLDKRRIEAQMLKHVYDTLGESHGKETAARTIGEAVRRSSVEQARLFAAAEPKGTSLESFADLFTLWTQDDALVIDVLARDAEHFDFNVTRCRYAEMYREMGLAEIGPLLSCQRDGTFCQGYDERIGFERSQTLMQGASHCDFRYRFKP